MPPSRIALINDFCRQNMVASDNLRIAICGDAAALCREDIARIARAAAAFDGFGPCNDPYGEHDVALFDVTLADGRSRRCYFQFDYYDPSLKFASDNPEDTDKTVRVLSMGFAADR